MPVVEMAGFANRKYRPTVSLFAGSLLGSSPIWQSLPPPRGPETIAWVKEMGAYHVIDHRQPMATRVAAPRLVARFTKLGDWQALPFEGGLFFYHSLTAH
jgi:hypothetical protein